MDQTSITDVPIKKAILDPKTQVQNPTKNKTNPNTKDTLKQ
jgi:hypothetical protein